MAVTKGDIFTFSAKGIPVGQPRPRAFLCAGKVRIYDPGTSDKWKEQIKIAARKVRPMPPLAGPIGVDVTFNIPRPLSHYRTGKNSQVLKTDAPWFVTGKPDIDNLEKALYDALTDMGFWKSDSQIVSAHVRKHYAARGHEGAAVEVFTLSREQNEAGEPWSVLDEPFQRLKQTVAAVGQDDGHVPGKGNAILPLPPMGRLIKEGSDVATPAISAKNDQAFYVGNWQGKNYVFAKEQNGGYARIREASAVDVLNFPRFAA